MTVISTTCGMTYTAWKCDLVVFGVTYTASSMTPTYCMDLSLA